MSHDVVDHACCFNDSPGLLVFSLTASADQLVEKAESSRSRDMSILMKSNAMRKACKEKTAEMTELDKQMANKLLELKNCE